MQSFPNCGPRTINSSKARARDPQLVPGIRLNRFLVFFYTGPSTFTSAACHFLGSVFPYISDLHFVSQKPRYIFLRAVSVGNFIWTKWQNKAKCLTSLGRKVESRAPAAHPSHSVSSRWQLPSFQATREYSPGSLGAYPLELDFTYHFEDFDFLIVDTTSVCLF